MVWVSKGRGLPYLWKETLTYLNKSVTHPRRTRSFAQRQNNVSVLFLNGARLHEYHLPHETHPRRAAARTPMAEVAGGGACLVDPFDVQSIRDGFLRVLNDPANRAALVERGFVNVEKCQAPAIAARYAALYREVAAIAGRRGR